MEWTRQDIIQYYKENEFAYFLWGRNMHYGYWEEDTKTQRQASQRFNEVMAAKARITEKDHVLDAGCGVGGSSIALAKKTGCRVTGVTICPRQVKLAYKNAEKEGVAHLTDFYEMDYQNTTFEDGKFDVVWGLESICYAESKEAFIKEAFRVLKSNGRLIVADGFASKDEYFGKEKKLMQRWLDGWIVNFLNTPRDFIAFAKKAGFAKSDYTDVTEKVFRTSQLMFYTSLFFLPFHLIDRVVRIKSYPTDALFNQYFAMKQKLWEYGIFFAEK
jgi:cyclopropane fatty-acyl-phospholipid synthase-like methyltransferase